MAAGDEVDVAVEDGLAGVGAVVGTHVEAGDGGVGGGQGGGLPLEEAEGGGDFVWGQVAEGRDVAEGDDEGVARGDGEAVAEGENRAFAVDDTVGGQGAEGAGGFRHAGGSLAGWECRGREVWWPVGRA